MKLFRSTLLVAIGLAIGVLALAPKTAHTQVATPVQVMNTPSTPVPNRDVDNPGRHAFLGQCSASPPADCIVAAPASQRVVGQYVNARINARKCDNFVLQQITDGPRALLTFPCVAAGKDTWVAQGPITFFIEPGSTVFGHWSPTLASDESLSMTLTGYTITP